MGDDLFVFGLDEEARLEQPWLLTEDVPTNAISFSSRNSSESFSLEQSL